MITYFSVSGLLSHVRYWYKVHAFVIPGPLGSQSETVSLSSMLDVTADMSQAQMQKQGEYEQQLLITRDS